MASTPVPATITMTTEQYTALVALARRAGTDAVQLEAFLVDIEKSNNITRYLLWVQWQELEQALPPTTKFPEQWPPNLRLLIQQVNTPIAQADVMNSLAVKAKKPTNILVTKDPAALVGWTSVTTFFTL
jgi:hypothetical protein